MTRYEAGRYASDCKKAKAAGLPRPGRPDGTASRPPNGEQRPHHPPSAGRMKGEIIMKKTTNTHGLTMKGLRKAAGETKSLTSYYSGHYVQISYDTSSGEILTNYHYNIGQNSWTQYHSGDIITICNASSPMTMPQIADAIAEAVARHTEAAALR